MVGKIINFFLYRDRTWRDINTNQRENGRISYERTAQNHRN